MLEKALQRRGQWSVGGAEIGADGLSPFGGLSHPVHRHLEVVWLLEPWELHTLPAVLGLAQPLLPVCAHKALFQGERKQVPSPLLAFQTLPDAGHNPGSLSYIPPRAGKPVL